MEEHAGRYTTNQDDTMFKHISNNSTPWKVLDYSLRTFNFPNIHGEVGINKRLPGVLQLFKLCAAAVSSRFLYKWKKSPSPLSSPEIHCFYLPPFSHEIPQVKILDYVTIQKQGPYLQQLHIKLSLFMYIGALRLLWVKRMTGCLCNGLQSHDFFFFSRKMEENK